MCLFTFINMLNSGKAQAVPLRRVPENIWKRYSKVGFSKNFFGAGWPTIESSCGRTAGGPSIARPPSKPPNSAECLVGTEIRLAEKLIAKCLHTVRNAEEVVFQNGSQIMCAKHQRTRPCAPALNGTENGEILDDFFWTFQTKAEIDFYLFCSTRFPSKRVSLSLPLNFACFWLVSIWK